MSELRTGPEPQTILQERETKKILVAGKLGSERFMELGLFTIKPRIRHKDSLTSYLFWSKTLLPLDPTIHNIRLQNNYLQLYKQGRLIDTIDHTDFRVIIKHLSYPVKAFEHGWLLEEDQIYKLGGQKYLPQKFDCLLHQAQHGKRPTISDNQLFLQVPPQESGRKFMQLLFESFENKERYLLDGVAIKLHQPIPTLTPRKIDRPLYRADYTRV